VVEDDDEHAEAMTRRIDATSAREYFIGSLRG